MSASNGVIRAFSGLSAADQRETLNVLSAITPAKRSYKRRGGRKAKKKTTAKTEDAA